MIIALDYDGTYTRAPRLWDDFIALADAGGYSVVVVTMRDENDPLPAEPPGRNLWGANSYSTPIVHRIGIRTAQVLSRQSRFGFGGSGEEAAKITDHLLIAFRLLQSDQRFSIEPRSMSLPDDIFAPYTPENLQLQTGETNATSRRW